MTSRTGVEDVRAEGAEPAPRRRRFWQRRPVEDHDVETALPPVVLLATVTVACLTVAAVLALTAWAYAVATGSSDPTKPPVDPIFEVHDKLVWLAGLVIAAVVGLVFAWTRRPVQRLLESWPLVALTVAGTAGIAISAAWIDQWIGLGPINLMLAVVVAPLLVLALGPGAGRRLPFLWPAVVTIGTALYLPVLWQTPRGMYDAFHDARSIDELLGPVAGNMPLADYVPQYGGLLGLPLAPFRPLVAAHVEWSVMSYISVLCIITVGALCAAAALMLPPGRRALGPLLVVPVLLMKPGRPDSLTPAGLQRLFQTIPERSLLPAVLAVVLLLAAARPGSRRRWLWVGAVAGLAALSNVESGATATLSAVLVLVALRPGWRAFGYAAAAWVGVWVAYVGLVLLVSGTFHPEYWIGFSLEFAGGFAALPMPAYGNYVFVLFVLVASTASAFPVLWRRSAALSVSAVGGLYFGSWGLLMFPYYVGRSASLGQLQFFFIPASVAAVWLLVGAAAAMRGRSAPTRLGYAALLCCLPAALFATTVIKAPAPDTNIKRLSGGYAPSGVFRSTLFKREPVVSTAQVAAIHRVSAGEPKPVGLFFTSGNVAALKTGLPNASIVAVPEEMMPHRPWSGNPDDMGNANFRRWQCRSLEQSDLRTVIAEASVADALDSCTAFTRGPLDQGMVVFTRTTG